MFSLSDRLKGLATQIEATGSQLQAKAIGQNQQPPNPSASGSSSSTALETSSSPRPASPNVTTKSNSITSPITSPTSGSQLGASPTRTLSGNYATSTSALAENALSGLRKSFNFANRQSSPLHDSQAQSQAQGQSQSQNQSSGQHARSGSSSSINNAASSQPQELKDIPSSPKPANGDKSDSRPGSPAKGLIGGHFQLGSDPSSLMATPVIPRSPNLAHPSPLPLRSHSPLAFARSASPSSSRRPTPNPEEPATYPLPPSPVVSPTSLHVPTPLASATTTQYSDPLGASPLLPPTEQEVPEEKLDVGKSSVEEKDEAVIPALDIEEPTPTGPTPTDEKTTLDADKEIAAATEALDLVDKHSTADLEAGSVTAVETAPENVPRPSVEMSAPTTPAAGGPDADLERQLAAAERRYENLSNRFTTLLTQKHNADKVLREFTPLEGGIQDHEALEGWVRMMKGKVDMITEEMKRLQGKISLQESRIEELRDTHRLEGSSQTELITKLRAQLAAAEKNLESKGNDLIATSTLRSDLAKAQTAAKDEEEKRTKAISLLKTVRLKLVKVEKEKEEVERDRAEERAERSHAKEELEKLKADREREVSNLRKGFEKELSSAREKFEKELQAKKAAWELEMITTKASHAKELSGKSTKVNGLESIVKELSSVKQKQFEELESRQAEVESSRAEMEGLRNRTKELEFQLRESNERLVLLEDSARDEETQGSSATSSVEIQRMLAEAEARAEVRLSDLRNKIRLLENERNDNEEDWARKLSERVRELEKLRRVIQEKETEYNDSIRSREDKERLIEEGRAAREEVEREVKRLKGEVEAAKGDVEVAIEAERAARADLASVQADLAALQAQLDESKSYGDKLKNNNKTLREEMRKIQSSVQLMEKQRNPGVGYWSSSNPSGAGVSRSSITSPEPSTPLREGRPSMESSRTAFSAATQSANGASTGMSTPTDKDNKEEEEVNLEYLRNVILQFLEHREMRPNLVRVLSVILRFTPQELRRLNAKLLS